MGPGDVIARAACLLRVGVAVAAFAAAMPLCAADLEARSGDGRWILRADNSTRELIAIDAASGVVVKRIAVVDRRGVPSRVARLLDAPPRASFIALLADVPEAWELPYDPRAEPVFEGLVHDYRTGEGVASAHPLPVRRIVLDEPITDALFAPRFDHLVGAVAGGRLHVVNLNVRRRIESVQAGGDPRPDAGTVWLRDRSIFLIPDGAVPRLHVLDVRNWRLRAPIDLPAVATAVRIVGDTIEAVTVTGIVRLETTNLQLE